jgi:hypothetical protein
MPGDRVIFLGTVLVTNLLSFVDVAKGERFSLILLNAAFVDFVYQITKATVQSWKLVSRKSTQVSFQAKREDVLETLASRPELKEGFYRCLSKYALTGLPGATTEGAPHPAYQAPLTLLVAFAERFMLAHGYAIVALPDPRFEMPGGLFPKRREDFDQDDWITAPDHLAAWITLNTAAELDLVDPMIALQGCLIALHCLEVIESAVDVLTPQLRDRYRNSRPSSDQRRQALESAYFSIVRAKGMPEADAAEALAAAREAAQPPLLLWNLVRDRLVAERKSGSRPSPVWN